MYDYRKLRGLITEHFGTLGRFAKAIGMSSTTLNTRLNGTTYFNQTEIEIISKKLLLTPEQVNIVFFTHK